MTQDATAGSWATLKRRALSRAQPLNAALELTHRCNWRCAFCYLDDHEGRDELTAREWCEVVDDLRSLGTLTVTLTGGEPLAHPGFQGLASYVRKRALALRVFTNAALVDEGRAKALAALDPLSVEVSLHGAEAATHDRATGVPGSFDAMLRGLRLLREHGLRLVLKSPLTRLNENELDGLLSLAARLDVPLRIDPRLTPRDDGDRGPLDYRASRTGRERLSCLQAKQGCVPEVRRESGGANCGSGTLTVAIGPTGDVYPCLQWKAMRLGNVRRTRLAHLWPSSPVRQHVAALVRGANDMLLARGAPFASAPFCPGLAAQAGDPLALGPEDVEQARLFAEAAAPRRC